MKYIEQLIAQYLLGTISEEEREFLQRWIDESPNRKELIRSLLNGEDFLRKYRRYAAVDVEQAKYRFVQRIKPIMFRPRWARVWYVAAVLVPLVALSVWFFLREVSDTPQFTLEQVTPGTIQATLILDNGKTMALTGKGATTIALDDSLSAEAEDGAITYRPVREVRSKIEYHTIAVPRGGEYRITLSDGTRVHINADSKLRFPVSFSGNERVVQLVGEAFFEVEKADCPFVVEVGNTRVRQYGTVFNINAYGVSPEIVLVSGNIGISGEGKAEVALVPGQLATCGEQIVITNVDVRPYIEWTKGRFTFEDERLADIIPDLMRWYDVEIEILDDSVGDMRFTGSVGRNETIEHIMNAISYSQGVQVVVKGNKIEIFK